VTRIVACLVAALAIATQAAQSRSPLELATAEVPPPNVRMAYGLQPFQVGELRVPTMKGRYPVAILVHGGCWMSKLGNMDERAVAWDNMRPLAVALNEAGIATWNIEYRRLGNPGGGWPGTFQDVALGADFLRELAQNTPIDLKRVIAIGHSSGGHLAAWLAARPRLPKSSELYSANPLPLAGVVNLDGPMDLKAALPQEKSICGSPVITNLLGGSPDEQPGRYREASPAELMPLGVPVEFFAGRMFAPQVAGYQAAIERTGDKSARVTALPTAGHFQFIDPLSEVWPQVLNAVRRLLSMPVPGV
jgi:acetyl esterase/lipase